MKRLNDARSGIQIENVFALLRCGKKSRMYPWQLANLQPILHGRSSKVTRFTKCLPSTAQQLHTLQRDPMFANPKWPMFTQHFCSFFGNVRNIRRDAFVYTSAAVSGLLQVRYENPAVAAAGQWHAVIPAVSPGSRGVWRRDYSPLLCVSTVLPTATARAADSILEREYDTHENPIIGTQRRIRCRPSGLNNAGFLQTVS